MQDFVQECLAWAGAVLPLALVLVGGVLFLTLVDAAGARLRRLRWPQRRSGDVTLILGGLVLPLAALLAGCQAGPTARATRPVSEQETAVILHVPDLPQAGRYECGLVTARNLTGYYGDPLPEPLRARLLLRAEQTDGLSGGDLRAALEEVGLQARLFEGHLDRSPEGVLGHLDAGHPLVVLLREEGGSKHYNLLAGYDAVHRRVFLVDPRRGWIERDWASFEADWAAARHFTLLAVPAGEAEPGTALASGSGSDLAAMKGGEIEDHDVELVLATVGIVILIALLL